MMTVKAAEGQDIFLHSTGSDFRRPMPAKNHRSSADRSDSKATGHWLEKCKLVFVYTWGRSAGQGEDWRLCKTARKSIGHDPSHLRTIYEVLPSA